MTEQLKQLAENARDIGLSALTIPVQVVLGLIAERDDANQQLRKEQLTVQEMRAQRDADEALMREVLAMLEEGDLLCELKASVKLRARLGGV
jgi:hypothetical protein